QPSFSTTRRNLPVTCFPASFPSPGTVPSGWQESPWQIRTVAPGVVTTSSAAGRAVSMDFRYTNSTPAAAASDTSVTATSTLHRRRRRRCLAELIERRLLARDVLGERLLHEVREVLAREHVAREDEEPRQLLLELARVLEALLGLARERLQDDGLELVGNAPVVGRRRHDLDVAHLLQRGEV